MMEEVLKETVGSNVNIGIHGKTRKLTKPGPLTLFKTQQVIISVCQEIQEEEEIVSIFKVINQQ